MFFVTFFQAVSFFISSLGHLVHVCWQLVSWVVEGGEGWLVSFVLKRGGAVRCPDGDSQLAGAVR